MRNRQTDILQRFLHCNGFSDTFFLHSEVLGSHPNTGIFISSAIQKPRRLFYIWLHVYWNICNVIWEFWIYWASVNKKVCNNVKNFIYTDPVNSSDEAVEGTFQNRIFSFSRKRGSPTAQWGEGVRGQRQTDLYRGREDQPRSGTLLRVRERKRK